MKDIASQMLTFVKEVIRKTIANATTTTIAATTATTTVVIAAAAAADKQEFSESKESAESSDHASQAEETSRWNSEDIEYFDSNYDEQSASIDTVVKQVEKNTYYKNVHMFIERVKEMITVLDVERIRQNLFIYLREIILIWHTAELSDDARQILTYEEEVEHWTKKLITRFKKLASIATVSLLRERYIMKNARRNRESRKYAQKIIRSTKSVELDSIFNQLNIIYNEVEMKLRRDLRRLDNTTIIDFFLQKMNECKNIWWSLVRDRRSLLENFNREVYSNRQDQYQFNTNFDRYLEHQKQWFYNQYSFQQSFESWKYQYSSSTTSAQASSTTKTSESRVIFFSSQKLLMSSSQLRIDSRTSMKSTQKNQEYQNFNQEWNNSQQNYQNFQKNQNNNRQYQEKKQWQEDRNQKRWNQKAYHDHNEEQDIEAHWSENNYYEDRSYDETLRDIENYESEDETMKQKENISFAHFITSSNICLICRICQTEFFFNNKLHRHIRHTHEIKAKEIAQTAENDEMMIETSSEENLSKEFLKKLSVIYFSNRKFNREEFAFRSH
jgi:hypothetical protein